MANSRIRRDMTLGEIVSRFPGAAEIMMNYGLHCVGCHVAAWESLEEGARAHGMSEAEIEEMLNELNKFSTKD